jgi:hypothetical protein
MSYLKNDSTTTDYSMVIIIFTAVLLLIMTGYFYVYKDNVILRSYFSLQYQLFNVYNTNIDYYKVFYNIFFVSIVVIISTVLYWDTIYKTAKKTSKCYEISKIIEENINKSLSSQFLYTIIIFNNDKIDKSISKYFLKITYDFKKMKTTIDYGNDNGRDNDLIANYKPNNEASQKLIGELNTISDNPQPVVYKKNEAYKKFYYFDLKFMKSAYLEGINTDILNSDIYSYISIDANNKVVKNYSSNTLLKFTKEYSMNENYNTSIIYDILFAKKNIDKLSL